MSVTGYSVWTCDVCGKEETTPLPNPDRIPITDNLSACKVVHDRHAIEAKGWRLHIGGIVVCSERCRDLAELKAAEERLEMAHEQIARLEVQLGIRS